MREITVGQVYREKDGRFTRYVTVVGWRVKNKIVKPRIRTCREDGHILISGRVTTVKPETLEKRFEFIR